MQDKIKIIPFASRLLPASVNGGFKMSNYWVWGGSVAKDECGLYHMFASRWPKNLPMFEGYKKASEIVRAVSSKAEGPYEFVETVLPQKAVNDCGYSQIAHNPTIHKAGNTYLLYYITSVPKTNPKTKDIFRICLAVSQSLCGPWKTFDQPVLNPRVACWDKNSVTNPAVCILKNKKIMLYYRSNTKDGIGLAEAEDFSGPYKRKNNNTVIKIDDETRIEDTYVWWNGHCFEMLAKDISGKITTEVKAGVHFYSADGINWNICKKAKAYSRNVIWDNGTQTVQGCIERPQLLFNEKGKPTHLFVATGDGPGDFRNSKNTWNMVIPLDPKIK